MVNTKRTFRINLNYQSMHLQIFKTKFSRTEASHKLTRICAHKRLMMGPRNGQKLARFAYAYR